MRYFVTAEIGIKDLKCVETAYLCGRNQLLWYVFRLKQGRWEVTCLQYNYCGCGRVYRSEGVILSCEHGLDSEA